MVQLTIFTYIMTIFLLSKIKMAKPTMAKLDMVKLTNE